jgi:hypothetical protein
VPGDHFPPTVAGQGLTAAPSPHYSRTAEVVRGYVAERANVKNWKDTLAVLGYLLFCLILLLSAEFMLLD